MLKADDINPFALAKRKNRPLILDGAVGTFLQDKKFKMVNKLWSSYALLEKPELILKIHREYIDAGADIITTNTFRTNPAVVEKVNKKLDSKTLVHRAVCVASHAAQGYPVYIAGCNPPAEDCYQKERKISHKLLEKNHHNHISLLIDSGCHFVLNETQSHMDEIKIICEFCRNEMIPFVLSLYFDETLRLLSGEKFSEVFEIVNDYGPIAIGVNCIPTELFKKTLRKINKNLNWGYYLNCGSGEVTDEYISCGVSPLQYKKIVKSSLPKNPSFIGSCCGSNPEHTKEIKKLLDGRTTR